MKFRFILLCLSVITLFACKNEPKAPIAVPQPTVPAIPKTTSSPSNTIGNLKQEKPLSAYAIQYYTNLMWHYSAAVVINDKEKEKEYIGKWIKLKPDNTLETGIYDGPTNHGSWAVNEAKNIITIVEEAEQPISTEWKITTSSSSDAVMIWVGTKKYGNNGTQIKMLRVSDKPAKE